MFSQLTGTNVSWKIKTWQGHAAANLPKNNIEPYQNFTGSYKKSEGSGLTPKYTEGKSK